MILFVAPVGVALAQRQPKQPAPYQHLSMWRLLGGELITGLRNLWRWSRHLIPSCDRRENGLTT
jgi:hypothetical protein